jgi:hypothetical protein
MWDIILAIVIFVFIAGIIMQIVYIRVNLSHYAKENAVNIIPKQEGDTSKNTLKTYGLNIHAKHTLTLEEMHKLDPIPLSIPDISIVVCNTGIASKSIVYNKYKMMVVDKNTGCHNLILDILAQRTRYIVYDSGIYLVHYDSHISEKTKTKMMANNYVDNKLLESQEIIIVVKLNDSFEFKEIEDTRSCYPVSMVSFFDLTCGSWQDTKIDDGSIGDISTISNTFFLPFIVLGFST